MPVSIEDRACVTLLLTLRCPGGSRTRSARVGARLSIPAAARGPRSLPPLVWAVVLGVAGLALDSLGIPVLGRGLPPFRLGEIAVLVAFVRFGTGSGLVAAVIAFTIP